MSKQKPMEIIHPPNTLKVKVGGSTEGPDMDAIKRAEEALAELQGEMGGWLLEELDRLHAAQAAFASDPSSTETKAGLYSVAHDLKGLGATYGFPLVGRISGSLCILISGHGGNNPIPGSLVDAHINAIKVIVRDEVKEADDAIGSALASELEVQVTSALAAIN